MQAESVGALGVRDPAPRMEIVPHKNTYGYNKVTCPFCTLEVSVARADGTNPDALRNLKRHITNEAKIEALEYFLAEDKNMAPVQHLTYYKEHTAPTPQKAINIKRQYDTDLTI